MTSLFINKHIRRPIGIRINGQDLMVRNIGVAQFFEYLGTVYA
jgi:hypothetical protein